MISAKQAKENQRTINWKDNKKAVRVFEEEKKEVLKEIEEEIHKALVGDSNYISYFIYTKTLYSLERVASSTEYSLAHEELIRDVCNQLNNLGYKIETVKSNVHYTEWWEISW